MPNTQRLAVVLTIINSVLLIIGLDRHGSAFPQGDAPVLRGRGLELVDASGRLKAEG